MQDVGAHLEHLDQDRRTKPCTHLERHPKQEEQRFPPNQPMLEPKEAIQIRRKSYYFHTLAYIRRQMPRNKAESSHIHLEGETSRQWKSHRAPPFSKISDRRLWKVPSCHFVKGKWCAARRVFIVGLQWLTIKNPCKRCVWKSVDVGKQITTAVTQFLNFAGCVALCRPDCTSWRNLLIKTSSKDACLCAFCTSTIHVLSDPNNLRIIWGKCWADLFWTRAGRANFILLLYLFRLKHFPWSSAIIEWLSDTWAPRLSLRPTSQRPSRRLGWAILE